MTIQCESDKAFILGYIDVALFPLMMGAAYREIGVQSNTDWASSPLNDDGINEHRPHLDTVHRGSANILSIAIKLAP